MADTDDKTEQPTSKKLDDARKKGQVSRSKEAGTFFVLLAGVLSIWAFSSFLGKGMRQIMLNSFTLTREQIFSEDESRRLFVENLFQLMQAGFRISVQRGNILLLMSLVSD